MRNSTVDALLFLVDQAFDHKAWHGTGLRGSIRAVSNAQASWRPSEARHNIRELVLHTAYWKYAVRRLLTGEKRGSFPLKGSNWITAYDNSDSGWRRDVALLVQMHKELRAVVAQVDEKFLWKKPKGSKYTRLALIEGIASHDLYHAGQIQLLKKLGALKRSVFSMTSSPRKSRSSPSSRKRKPTRGSARTVKPAREVALAEVKDDLSRYLRMAEGQAIIITRHGKPAGVLIGFESEDDWFEYRLENDPTFLRRVSKARADLAAGRGIPLEAV